MSGHGGTAGSQRRQGTRGEQRTHGPTPSERAPPRATHGPNAQRAALPHYTHTPPNATAKLKNSRGAKERRLWSGPHGGHSTNQASASKPEFGTCKLRDRTQRGSCCVQAYSRLGSNGHVLMSFAQTLRWPYGEWNDERRAVSTQEDPCYPVSTPKGTA